MLPLSIYRRIIINSCRATWGAFKNIIYIVIDHFTKSRKISILKQQRKQLHRSINHTEFSKNAKFCKNLPETCGIKYKTSKLSLTSFKEMYVPGAALTSWHTFLCKKLGIFPRVKIKALANCNIA